MPSALPGARCRASAASCRPPGARTRSCRRARRRRPGRCGGRIPPAAHCPERSFAITPSIGANAPLAACSSQARRSSGVPGVRELECGVVVQVRSDARQSPADDGDAERSQVVGRPDTRAQQERGGVVGAGAHDHAPGVRPSRARPARRTTAPCARARRRSEQALDRRVAGRCAATAARARGRDRRARRSSARRRRCWRAKGATPVSASRSLRSCDARCARARAAMPARRGGTGPARPRRGCARACARSPPAAAARPRRATSRRGRSRRARRSRARCPRSRRSRCGSSSRRSCLRAGTRCGGRGSRRRSRSRAGATPRARWRRARPRGQPPSP